MAYRNGPKIVTDGLVLCLDAAGTKSYPGSGSTWYDLSGNGNNGTLNGVGYNSANGGSLSFDGSNDYINQSSPSLNLTNFTFSAFIKGSGLIFGSGAQESWPRYFQFQTNSFLFRPTRVIGNGIYYTITIPSPITNQWNMVSYVRTGSTMYAFQNGTLVNTYNSFPTNNLVTYSNWGQFIGKVKRDHSQWTNESFFTGNIANLSVYNRALTASEISQNYNSLKGRYGL